MALSPTGKGGRGIAIQTRAWEPGDAQQAWRVPLHPWDAGLNSDRLTNKRAYAKANADTSYNGLLLPPPLVTSVTMTNAVLPSKAKEFDGVLFFVSGRYMYYFNPATNAVVEDKDFGASKAAVDLEVFNSQLVVAMGETEKIYTRSIGINTSGTANAAVTSTDTTLTDTRLALTVNAYIGATVTCNGKTMVVTSNTATVFTGASWSGGTNPGNGNAWSVAGTWTQATDATYAIALGLVGARLWRAETTNRVSSCTTAPRTLTSWTPAGSSAYSAGDSTYAINTIIDYGGVAWVGKADGMYSPDPASRFINQTPQARNWPNTANCSGAFVAQGYLWVPTSAGLLRIKPGQSKVMGPEIVGRPDYRFWVRGGVEFSGAIYLLVTDEGAVEKTAIIKMVRDDEGLSGREYRYYEWARMAGTTKGYVIALTTKGTNPELVNGYGNDIRYAKLGRGGGRDIDDANYAYGTATELETGKVMPGPDLGVVSILQGVTTVLDFSAAGETLSVSYKVDGDGAYADLLNTQEGGGTAAISSTTNFQAVTRYAPTTAAGQFFEFKFTGALTSATGTGRPEILEAWAFGYSRPKVTDVVTVAIHAGPGTAGVNGIPNGQSAEETIRLFRNWMESSTVLACEIPEYEQGRTTRFLVTGVEVAEQTATIGQQHESTTSRVMVALTRVDVAGAYGDP